MSVVGLAAVQSLEELHRVVSTAVIQRRAIAAVYDEARRLFCPHVLGYNDPGEYRVFCYQYGGERAGTDRRQMPLVGSGAVSH